MAACLFVWHFGRAAPLVVLTSMERDLDHFRTINDHLGHAIGDEVLRHAAEIMRRRCRATDLVARIGGEEFALVLSGMTRDVAAGHCDMLRRAFESYDWPAVHPQLRVTMSLGL